MGLPPSNTSPLLGHSSPAMQRISVDLPAPLGPIKPVMLPAGSSTLMLYSTWRLS